MSRVVVIGATGHIGTYLVPRLVRGGHEVIAMSRGLRNPYHTAPEWARVTRAAVDRDAEDAAGTFGSRVAELRPDVVVDLVCFTAASARQLVDALRPSRPLLLHCGTIWVHGPALRVPVTEDEPRTGYGEYGTGKAEIEALLHRETLAGGVPAVVLHPGHISGPGWPVITPAGNLDPAVWTSLATGQPLALPDHGLGVLHHVHADDVAQAFERALSRPAAIGASFHVVAEQAMTLRGHRRRALVRPRAGARLRGLGGVRAPGGFRGRGGNPRAHLPQHHREHRPGPRGARLRAALQHARCPAPGRGLARRPRPGGRRRPAISRRWRGLGPR
jgi:nucleoside-diphosphate-sugar epimerase